jgi:Divergent InlB B-repeat domain
VTFPWSGRRVGTLRRQLLVALVSIPLLALSTPRAQAAQDLVVGLWPQTYTQFLEIQSAADVSLGYFRSRQRAGQFDSQLVPSDNAAAAAAGYSLGLNIQPKTGSGQDRTGIPYTDITAQLRAGSGPYHDKLVSFANEVLALPTYGEVTHYLQFHSEANHQAPPGELDAQPYSGTAEEYRECFALVRALFDSMGVTDHIEWQVVLTRAAYEGNDGGPMSWFPADGSLYDLVGVDSYHRPNSWLTPSESFDSAIAFGRSVGKPVWIDETGADEGGPTGSPTAKAEWFAAMGSYLEANAADLAGVVFSHASDGGNWYLDSVLTGGRATLSYSGLTWDGWHTLATQITATGPSVSTLSVTSTGDGAGSITADVGGIDCGTICSASVDDGTQATLTATPAPGSLFVGWSGSGVTCPGTDPCSLTIEHDTTVTATFVTAARELTVSPSGAGSGVVTSQPAGIDCGTTCSAVFPHGTQITLTAAPTEGSRFTGWSGACAGEGPCVVTMDGAQAVGVTFTPEQHTLTVSRSGAGTGSVTSVPAGIACGSQCVAGFDHGSQVTLTAVPDPGMVFTGWSGGCSGTASCVVTLTAPVSATATFAQAPSPVTLADAAPEIAFDGWRGVVDPTADGGAYRINGVKGQSLTWASPTTTSITWIARTGPNLGRASVTIDGSSKGTVDLYASSPGVVSKVYAGLSNRPHTVAIKVLGTKSSASTGTSITHDAFVVGTSTTQESAASVHYANWQSTSVAGASDGTFRSTRTKNATATVVFSGTAIDWVTAFGRTYGKAGVTIDGVSKGTVDLYRSATTWQAKVSFGGLTSGAHAMVIKVLGTKSGASTGTDVVVDGFVVHP